MVDVPRQYHQAGGVGAVKEVQEASAALREVPPGLHQRVRRQHLLCVCLFWVVAFLRVFAESYVLLSYTLPAASTLGLENKVHLKKDNEHASIQSEPRQPRC